jgi:hypothetical protein
MTQSNKAVNSYRRTLAKFIETSSTELAPRREPLFTRTPRRGLLGNFP